MSILSTQPFTVTNPSRFRLSYLTLHKPVLSNDVAIIITYFY